MLKILRLCAFHKKKERAEGNSKQLKAFVPLFFVAYFFTGAKKISNKKVDMDFNSLKGHKQSISTTSIMDRQLLH